MKKIESLTPEQEKKMDEITAEYERIALAGDDSYDLDVIKEGINFIYALTDLKPAKIIVCSDPLDMLKKAKVKKGETFDCLVQGYDAGWMAYYDYMETVLKIEYEPEWKFDVWRRFIKQSGVWATVLLENAAFVCVRPCAVHRNNSGDLHSAKGPAIAWRSGYGQYYLNGVSVDESLVTTPAEKLDPTILAREPNAEVRREIVRKIGPERVLQKLGGKTLDKEGDYELVLLTIGAGRTWPYLKMKNPSIGVWHLEAVPQNIVTVDAAIEWRNGRPGRPQIIT